MIKRIAFLFLSFSNLITYSQQFKWAKSITGPGNAVGYTLINDSRNNLLVTGICGGLLDFDPGKGKVEIKNDTNSGSIFVLKLDSIGEIFRKEREKRNLQLRQVAPSIDKDQAVLSKIEREEKKATK